MPAQRYAVTQENVEKLFRGFGFKRIDRKGTTRYSCWEAPKSPRIYFVRDGEVRSSLTGYLKGSDDVTLKMDYTLNRPEIEHYII